MKLRTTLFYSISLFLLTDMIAYAQDKLDIFGFFQVNSVCFHTRQAIKNQSMNLHILHESKRNSFNVQQVNIFFQSELTSCLATWLNFELTNSYSSERNWGNLNLEEAWVKYSPSEHFKIKAGLLIPIFNNLNEVKNRMPYLPYVFRPMVYESSWSEMVDVEDFIPERAYLQVYGFFALNNFKLDYAAYIGNSETSYINGQTNSHMQSGIDSSGYALLGSRLGIRIKNWKLGFSMTADHDNQNAINLGDVRRYRFGGDLSVAISRLNLESEIMLIKHDLDIAGVSLDKKYYYAKLGYDVTDQLHVYVCQDYLEDDRTYELDNGMTGQSIGFSYRPSPPLVMKAQFVQLKIADANIPPPTPMYQATKLQLTINCYSIALSLFF